jgi:hypothetical protein
MFLTQSALIIWDIKNMGVNIAGLGEQLYRQLIKEISACKQFNE